MLEYLTNITTQTFQNDIFFKQSVNTMWNQLLSHGNVHIHSDQMVLKNTHNEYITTEDLFTNNIINLHSFDSKTMIHLDINRISGLHNHNYVLRMSKEQLIQSDLFIIELLKYSFAYGYKLR